MLEYKHFLETQYEKIYHKLLSDQSISVFKDLDNKDFMHRRVAEIFEKTYHAERENYVKTLIAHNNALRQQVKALGGDPSTSRLDIQPQAPIESSRSHEEQQKCNMIRENEDIKAKFSRAQTEFEGERERLRGEIIQLQENRRASDMRQSSLQEEWKEKENRMMDSLKEFIEDNKNLQTEILDLRSQLDGWRIKETVSTNDSQNNRKKHRELEVENKELIHSLNTNLHEIKNLNTAMTKLAKDNAFLEHRMKLLEQEKQHLQGEVSSLAEEREMEAKDNFQVLQLQCEAKDTLIKKMESNVSQLNRQLEGKSEEVLLWRENYETSLKQNNNQKVRLRYETELMELRSQMISTQQEFEKELQKRSERANNIMKEEVINLENQKHREKADNAHRLNTLTKEKYQLEEQLRTYRKEKDDLQGKQRAVIVDFEKDIDRMALENETLKVGAYNKDGQYRHQIKSLEELVVSLKRGMTQQSDKINELELIIVVSKRETKEARDNFEREAEKNQSNEVLLMRKEIDIKEVHKSVEACHFKEREIISKLTYEIQEKNQIRGKVIEQSSLIEGLHAEISRLKLSVYKSESEVNNVQLKYRSQIKEMIELHQEQVLNTKLETTHQVQEHMKAIQKVAMTQNHAAEISGRYEKAELERMYAENSRLKTEHAEDMMEINELNDALKLMEHEIKCIREEEELRSNEAKEQIRLLRKENEEILASLMSSKSQNRQYRDKVGEFKQQTGIMVKGILKMVWEDMLNMKEGVLLFEKQQKHQINTYMIELTDRLKHYSNGVNSRLREAYSQDYTQLREKCDKEMQANRDEWEQKCRKLQLDIMAMDAQRQMERAEVTKKMKIKETEIEADQENFEDVLRKNEELQVLCSKYPHIIKKLEEKIKEITEQMEGLRHEESRTKIKLEREHERSKKVETEYETKLSTYKSKYMQDNEDLFNRYEKSLQDMITKTTLVDTMECLQDTLSFHKSPLKKQTSLTSLRQQIANQRTRLKQLGGK